MNSGYLLINKPVDWTSFDVVKKTQNILKTKKIGHTGTLDPFATGLLLLLVEKATKYSQKLTNLDKEYLAVCKFGISTDTGDLTGNVTSIIEPKYVSKSEFLEKIPYILSLKKQIPSKFSAIKINGKRAYKLSRNNIDFQMPEKTINIKKFELVDLNFPYFTYKTTVSKGTYIRTLTEQIAKMFENVAVTVELQRTKIGTFELSNSININDIYEGMALNDISLLDELIRPIITIGSFDGVHTGHKFIINETVKIANVHSLPSAVLTFKNHPQQILNEYENKYLLTDFYEKEKLIQSLGISDIFYHHFDKKMSKMTANDFLENILMKEINPKIIVIGYDSHFGYNREGNADFLKTQSKKYNYEVIEIPPLKINDTIPSSSLIRKFISNGEVSKAKQFLGRYYSISGKVVKGKSIGKNLGYPTINIDVSNKIKLFPRTGVYFTFNIIKGSKYLAATNIGHCPTIKNEKSIAIESHLLDFSEDIYDIDVEILFIMRLRDENKFENIEKLTNQIENDIKIIKELKNDYYE